MRITIPVFTAQASSRPEKSGDDHDCSKKDGGPSSLLDIYDAHCGEDRSQEPANGGAESGEIIVIHEVKLQNTLRDRGD
jgi:hypothetical protein